MKNILILALIILFIGLILFMLIGEIAIIYYIFKLLS